MHLLEQLNKAYTEGRKMLMLLIDPDHFEEKHFENTLSVSGKNGIDIILAGGSLITKGDMGVTIRTIKSMTDIPVCIFPGNYRQIDKNADAILFMSLISGRNPDFLIGNQVIAAPELKDSGLEIIPTGYMLIDGGKLTTAHYMSNTLPIPADKAEIAACTALAGQMLGMKCIYADAGSGASVPLQPDFVSEICRSIRIPLIAGGGIRSAKNAKTITDAGATAVVIGNAAHENPKILQDIISLIK